MGRTHEKSMGTGRPRMPSLPGTYENRGSDQLFHRHSKDSQLSGPTVAGAAHRRSRSNVSSSTGMVLKQRLVTLLWASCAHSGHGCHLPRGIGPCSPRSNPSRAAPASRSRRSQRESATRSTLCLHGSSSVHPLIFLSAAEAATNIEDSAAARCQLPAVSTQLSVQRSASKISRNFFAKCKEVTEEKLIHFSDNALAKLPAAVILPSHELLAGTSPPLVIGYKCR